MRVSEDFKQQLNIGAMQNLVDHFRCLAVDVSVVVAVAVVVVVVAVVGLMLKFHFGTQLTITSLPVNIYCI